MRKIIVVTIAIIFFTIIILSRKYSENHIFTFVSGIYCALTVAFFLYILHEKRQYLKKK